MLIIFANIKRTLVVQIVFFVNFIAYIEQWLNLNTRVWFYIRT